MRLLARVRAAVFGGLSLQLLAAVHAAVPPAEQWLPSDTLAVWTVPDWGRLEQARRDTPLHAVWSDPELKPFRDKLVGKVHAELVAPVERELGLRFADYADLLRGQLTVAITRNGWTGTRDPLPALIVILDTRDQAERLKLNLTQLRQKLVENGRTPRTERIGGVEFQILDLNSADLQGRDRKKGASGDAASKPDSSKPPFAVPFAIGQMDSVMLAGTSVRELEKVVARMRGGAEGSLAQLPAFAADQKRLFNGAAFYGWVHFASVAELALKALGSAQEEGQVNPMIPAPEKIASAVGVAGIQTMAAAVRPGPEGGALDLFLGVPEDQRRGLLKLLMIERADAAPPAFVPADAVRFSRWRMDGASLWPILEGAVNEVSPGVLEFLITPTEAAIQQKDPSFNLRRNLFGNLGHDLVSYQKSPRGTSLEDLSSPPAITLVASPNPDQLLGAIQAVILLLPPPLGGAEFKETEFQGRTIHSMPLPALPTAAGGTSQERELHLVASGGYVAFTTDRGLVEEYLRSSDAKPKPLAELQGLAEAGQKVGGMASGFFGFQNDAENLRVTVEALRSNAGIFDQVFALSPLGSKTGAEEGALKAWVDLSLLPSSDKIARHFGITVFAGHMTADGFTLKFFSHNPPGGKP